MEARLTIHTEQGMGTISKRLYGYFSEHLGRCIYEGTWVGEDSEIPNIEGIRTDVLEALRGLGIPVLRWPGGLFADTYHWRDGVGPRQERQPIVNVFWGGNAESNQFGTHEYFRLCELLGCEPYLAVNMGSGSIQEMADWIEYLTYDGDSRMTKLRRANGREKPWKLKYIGIGNEAWGGGGKMRPEYYADEFRRYACYCRSFAKEPFYKVACGPYGGDTHWTEVLLERAGDMIDGMSLHYYTQREPHRGRATGFGEDFWFDHMELAWKMDQFLTDQDRVMSRYDPRKRIGLIVDEWGTSFEQEEGTNPRFLEQQNTLLDALVACIHLNAFNEHNDRVHMANLAQTVNVIQAVLLTKGPQMIKTPTYHVMEMFRPHHQAERVAINLRSPLYAYHGHTVQALTASVSRHQSDELFVTLGNCDPYCDIWLDVEAGAPARLCEGRVLTDSIWDAHNTFEDPDRLHPVPFDQVETTESGCRILLPAKSVTALRLTLAQ